MRRRNTANAAQSTFLRPKRVQDRSNAQCYNILQLLSSYFCVQIEGFLEEMVLLCQRSEEYNQFVVAKLGAVASAAKTEAAARETSFRGGAFNMAVRELVSYYIALVGTSDWC